MSAGCRVLVLCCLVVLQPLAYAEEQQWSVSRKLLASPPESVSIFDGTLPSPELGPLMLAQAPTQAPATTMPAATAVVKSAGVTCGSGCIAGSIIGGVVFIAILLGICMFMCCRRSSVKDEVTSVMSTTDLELLEHPVQPARGPLSFQIFRAGDPVFCQRGRNCMYGTVVSSAKGDAYKVQYSDGSTETLHSRKMVPNWPEGMDVMYSPPEGRPSITGTLLLSDGSYWPPFYQVSPHDGSLNIINTTAEYLTKLKKEQAGSNYIVASAV